jgi:hypothetical protein
MGNDDEDFDSFNSDDKKQPTDYLYNENEIIDIGDAKKDK